MTDALKESVLISLGYSNQHAGLQIKGLISRLLITYDCKVRQSVILPTSKLIRNVPKLTEFGDFVDY
jgi:hypothetical protein